MMLRSAAFAAALALTAAHAEQAYVGPFDALKQSFWRPVAGNAAPARLELYIGADALTARTPCFASGQAFKAEPHGQFAFSNEFTGGTSNDPVCRPVRAQFDAFAKMLKRATAYRRDGNDLILLGKDGAPLAAFAPIVPRGFEHRWLRVIRFRHDGAMLPGSAAKPPGEWPSLLFWNGTVEGSLSCGGTEGRYTLAGTKLKAWALTMLAGFCNQPEAPQAVVDSIHDDLGKGARTIVFKRGGIVDLRDGKGDLRMELEPHALP